MSIFIVQSHDWDYDFHDQVESVFPTRDAAIAFINKTNPNGRYDARRQKGYVIEEWPLGEAEPVAQGERIVWKQGDSA